MTRITNAEQVLVLLRAQLERAARSGKKRRVEAMESRECDVPEPAEGQAWWRGPEEDEDEGVEAHG